MVDDVAELPLAGFSHGAAGIAYALARLALEEGCEARLYQCGAVPGGASAGPAVAGASLSPGSVQPADGVGDHQNNPGRCQRGSQAGEIPAVENPQITDREHDSGDEERLVEKGSPRPVAAAEKQEDQDRPGAHGRPEEPADERPAGDAETGLQSHALIAEVHAAQEGDVSVRPVELMHADATFDPELGKGRARVK